MGDMGNILVTVDPSGNHGDKSGFGSTGIAFFVEGVLVRFTTIEAETYQRMETYWYVVWETISNASTIVCEDFRLFGHKAKQQTGSNMETSQLIGYLRMKAWGRDIPFVLQDPTTKTRHSDEVLTETGFLQKNGKYYYCLNQLTNLHERDAIRHGLYFLKYGKG